MLIDNIKSQFVIDELPNLPGRWYVDWSKLGGVEKDITKARLCGIVFDKVKPKWEIGIGYNVQCFKPKHPDMLWPKTIPRNPNNPVPEQVFELEEFTKWEVLWISYDAWICLGEHEYDMFAHHLFRSQRAGTEATGIILETLDQAELFVDAMEAQYTFYMLKKTYATDW